MFIFPCWHTLTTIHINSPCPSEVSDESPSLHEPPASPWRLQALALRWPSWWCPTSPPASPPRHYLTGWPMDDPWMTHGWSESFNKKKKDVPTKSKINPRNHPQKGPKPRFQMWLHTAICPLVPGFICGLPSFARYVPVAPTIAPHWVWPSTSGDVSSEAMVVTCRCGVEVCKLCLPRYLFVRYKLHIKQQLRAWCQHDCQASFSPQPGKTLSIFVNVPPCLSFLKLPSDLR